ncbi:hypothetical protein K493DRAFT_407424 [Basidiobolus meristosporus CBS 931.73]|uniref:Uncharacterized protein n=1 Tax=Basidiobolus meristosporus CBS 931.73 TaxID=1314790 RepID=A0A1Y1YDB3_9FUNG|nr:hypothetical protein K493DRAFT_407424 [Basidiobolus meristosporus CBS 931.73]|eukprot:ORX95958.1 hypothetical protein K493DRAFT_407424 [Basidiobolus meristosporus CBS 931.73]
MSIAFIGSHHDNHPGICNRKTIVGALITVYQQISRQIFSPSRHIVLASFLAFTVVGIQLYRERTKRRLAKKCTQETVSEYVDHAFENSPVNEALPSYSTAGSEPAVPEVVVQSISRQAYENIISSSAYVPSNGLGLPAVSQLPPAYDQLQASSASRIPVASQPHSVFVQIPLEREDQQSKSA